MRTVEIVRMVKVTWRGRVEVMTIEEAESLRLLLGAALGEGVTDIGMITRATANHFSLTPEKMMSKGRPDVIAYPRQIAMYLCRRLTCNSTPMLAEYFGKKDHSTILYAFDQIEARVKNEPRTRKDVEAILATITALQEQAEQPQPKELAA